MTLLNRLPNVSALAALATFGLPSVALAGDAVVSPLVGRGVDSLVVLNMTSLISSELDFMGKYENVVQLEKMPAGMNAGCLASVSCLSGVSKANGGVAVIAGSVAAEGSKFGLSLVLFQDGKIVRTNTFKLPTTPSFIADSMGGYVKELVTGTTARQEAQASSLGDFDQVSAMALMDGEDEIEIAAAPKAASPASKPAAASSTTARSANFDDLPEDEDPDDSALRAEEERAAAASAAAATAEAKRKADETARLKAEAQAEAKRRADEAARAKAEALAEAKRRAEEEARAKAEAQAEARRRAEAAAEARAEAAAAAKAEAAAARAEAAAAAKAEAQRKKEAQARATTTRATAPEEEYDIQFGSATDSIQVEEISFGSAVAMIQVEEADEATPVPVPARTTTSSARTSSTSVAVSSARSAPRPSDGDDLDLLEEPDSFSSRSKSPVDRDEEEEEDKPRNSSSGSSSRPSTSSARTAATSARSGSSRSSSYRDLDEPVHAAKSRADYADSDASLTGRLGYSPYQGLDFVTYGVELAYMATRNLALVGGIEAFSVKRNIPPALLADGENPEQWNTILPLNLGLQGRFGQGAARPYIGADVVAIPGYVKEEGGVALGGRGRLGLDILISSGFGLNLNGALGMMSGENFEQVQAGLKSSDLSPQVSAGTVIRF